MAGDEILSIFGSCLAALQLLAWFLYDPQPAAFFKPLMHGWLTGWLLLNNLISQELVSMLLSMVDKPFQNLCFKQELYSMNPSTGWWGCPMHHVLSSISYCFSAKSIILVCCEEHFLQVTMINRPAVQILVAECKSKQI